MIGESIIGCALLIGSALMLIYIFIIIPPIDNRVWDLKLKLMAYAKCDIDRTLPDGYEINIQKLDLENPILGIPLFTVIDCYMEYRIGGKTYSYKFMSTKPWEFTRKQHDRFYKAFQKTDFCDVCRKCHNKYIESVIEEAC